MNNRQLPKKSRLRCFHSGNTKVALTMQCIRRACYTLSKKRITVRECQLLFGEALCGGLNTLGIVWLNPQSMSWAAFSYRLPYDFGVENGPCSDCKL